MESISSSWMVLKKSLFVDFIKEDLISIYDTEAHTSMLSKDAAFVDLINKFYIPENIGCIEAHNVIKSEDFEKAMSLGYIYIVDAKRRPINLLPILNLQSDLQRNGDLHQRISLLGSKLALISGIRIELSPMVPPTSEIDSVVKRGAAINQYCLYTSANNNYSRIDNLLRIVQQLSLTSISVIDLYCNRDVLNDDYKIQTILEAIPSYVGINIHLMVDEYYSFKEQFNSLFQFNENRQLKLYADKHSPKEAIIKCLNSAIDLSFFAYSKEDIFRIASFDNNNIDICPVVLKDNIDWIESCVSIPHINISKGTHTFNSLFRNMKLNANFFGIIDIDSAGHVRPHGSGVVLGYLSDKNFSLINTVVKELEQNNSWRITRDSHDPCIKCGLRFLCPPVSIFELNGLIDKICR